MEDNSIDLSKIHDESDKSYKQMKSYFKKVIYQSLDSCGQHINVFSFFIDYITIHEGKIKVAVKSKDGLYDDAYIKLIIQKISRADVVDTIESRILKNSWIPKEYINKGELIFSFKDSVTEILKWGWK